ncbi:MAG: helix-turn-helix transcriptional regulator [Gammaproteobacteria bacterium]|nr:helix-turn-helix transcriptional regulator [Gammaproteobacteria bacterium]
MSEFLTTREVAELLRIKERKVYDLAARGKIPCSRATGKLLFPKTDIEQWLENSQSGQAARTASARPAVLLGSHDPLLEWALRESGCGIATFFDGSLDGIERYLKHEGLATGLHLFDATSREWNITCVRQKLLDEPAVLMEWAKRQRGIIVANHCEKPIAAIEDLAGLKIVPRQAGAGTQQLLTSLLGDAGLSEGDFDYLPAERTESDAVLPILQGKADATLGLAALARQYKLRFIPLIEERFDIVVDRKAWFDPPWQKFLSFCDSSIFRDKVGESEGYDTGGLGTIHFNGR